MANFAQVIDGIVTNVIVIADEHQANGEEFIKTSLGLPGRWIQTSYNTFKNEHILGGTPLRKNYAGIGFKYDEEKDAFIPPKPYNSWVLNEDICQWEPPLSHPNDGKFYYWDEEALSWVEVNG